MAGQWNLATGPATSRSTLALSRGTLPSTRLSGRMDERRRLTLNDDVSTESHVVARVFRRLPNPTRILGLALCLVWLGCGSSLGPVAKSAAEIALLPADTKDARLRGIGDDDIAALGRLKDLECFDVGSGRMAVNQKVTVVGFTRLADLQLSALESVIVSHSDGITDEAIAAIARNRSVKLLVLSESGPFGTEGVRSISGMPALTWLDLRGCKGVTDECIPDLVRLRSMEPGGLRVTGSGITVAGIKKLRTALGSEVVDDDQELWKADR